ncbi:MAG TPA: lipoyl(octanoyl) transferase LipB [Burkholderiales bacterium]|nr:lipoyl(octanoyl) transferase LipB [Burkholderiales bacterium]
MGATSPLIVRRLGLVDYATTYAAMRRFTSERKPHTPDELWLLQHSPVYTLGQAGKPEHLLYPTHVPVLSVDRGGQITYHAPGQIVVYTLLDLRRRGLHVRQTVSSLEQAIIDFLASAGLVGERRVGAPGVYVKGAKIAALGLRVRNGCCYHGLALNVDMALEPFADINPCGYPGLAVTQLKNLGVNMNCDAAGEQLAVQIARQLQTRLE